MESCDGYGNKDLDFGATANYEFLAAHHRKPSCKKRSCTTKGLDICKLRWLRWRKAWTSSIVFSLCFCYRSKSLVNPSRYMFCQTLWKEVIYCCLKLPPVWKWDTSFLMEWKCLTHFTIVFNLKVPCEPASWLAPPSLFCCSVLARRVYSLCSVHIAHSAFGELTRSLTSNIDDVL